jgi:hypothetical protein
MRLELPKRYPNLLNVLSKYGGASLFYIMKACCVAPAIFERALSNFQDILNVQRTTSGASVMALE